MKSTSPPVSVHATPVATPGREVRNDVSCLESRRPEIGLDLARLDDGVERRRAGSDPRRNLPGDGANLPLEIADPGLACVLADHEAQRVVR